ncbi:MAG: hypothetical protein AAFV53_00955 [Myxococcota bacterium]
MVTEESGNNGAAFNIAGAGCAGVGCLLMIGAIALFGALAAGVFNYSLEGQVSAGGGTSLCCGLMSLFIGIVLIVVGRSRS